jgi:predicted metal-binding membrane protein
MRAETNASTRTLRPFGLTAGLAGAAIVSWFVLLEWRGTAMGMRMVGHADAVAFIVVWLAMVGAMMLPTIQPMVITHVAMLREAPSHVRRSRTAAFLVPYGAVWATAGLFALGVWLVGRHHPVVAGALIIVAGLHQLGALKTRCLRWCRSPLGFFLRYGNDLGSLRGSARIGARHAIICVGCCAGLMVGLTGAGVMSVSWLVALALLMLLEKTHPQGPTLARASGIALVTLGAVTTVLPLERATGEAAGAVALIALVVTTTATSAHNRRVAPASST